MFGNKYIPSKALWVKKRREMYELQIFSSIYLSDLG